MPSTSRTKPRHSPSAAAPAEAPMAQAPFPPYRTRYLPGMTAAQITALPGRGSAIVIVTTGSVEQHGPHLPVGVDAILGQGWLAAALQHVPAHVPVYVGPALTYGISTEHVGFPGTITISPRAFRAVLLQIARRIHALGFRNLAFLNTHGGNASTLVITLREIQSCLGMNAAMIAPTWKPPVDAQEAAYGFHAGRCETAWMLALAPHLVHMERAVCEYPARLDDPGELRPEGPSARLSWMTADISRNGVMGDATAARADQGRAWFDAGARSLAAQIVALATALGETAR